MSAVAQELIKIVDGLSEEKAREVVDFARFLREQAGDAAWESIVAAKRAYPKLDKFAADALREGTDEPLDPNKL